MVREMALLISLSSLSFPLSLIHFDSSLRRLGFPGYLSAAAMIKDALSMFQAGVSERRAVLRDVQRTVQYMTHSDGDTALDSTASRLESIKQRAMESTFQPRIEASAAGQWWCCVQNAGFRLLLASRLN